MAAPKRKKRKVFFTEVGDDGEDPDMTPVPTWFLTDLHGQVAAPTSQTYFFLLRIARPLATGGLLAGASRDRIVEGTGLSVASVKRSVKELIDRGAITRTNTPARGEQAEYLVNRFPPSESGPAPAPGEDLPLVSAGSPSMDHWFDPSVDGPLDSYERY